MLLLVNQRGYQRYRMVLMLPGVCTMWESVQQGNTFLATASFTAVVFTDAVSVVTRLGVQTTSILTFVHRGVANAVARHLERRLLLQRAPFHYRCLRHNYMFNNVHIRDGHAHLHAVVISRQLPDFRALRSRRCYQLQWSATIAASAVLSVVDQRFS